MDGFHYAGPGGFVTKHRQLFAELILPPGKYIVFAKANIAVASNRGSISDIPGIERAYEAQLEMGSVEDSLIGSLRYDLDDPGSRYESISLNLAGEIVHKTHVKLMFSRSLQTEDLIVSEPRLSVIGLTELKIVTGAFERDDISLFPSVPIPGLSRRTMRSLLDDAVSEEVSLQDDTAT